MPNLSSIFSFKNRDPFAAIVLFALIVVGVETVLGLLPDPKWRGAFIRTLTLPSHNPDIQVMGDSIALEGILTPTLAAELPGHPDIWTLAKAGTGPEFPYFMLRRELACGLTPKMILYAPAAHTFASDRIVVLVGAFCTWPEIWEIARAGKAPMDVLYGVFCKLSFTLRNREQLGEMMRGKKPGQAASPVYEKPANPQPHNRGYFNAKQLPPMYKNTFSIWDFNRFYFEKFLSLANAHHIPIYWVTSPIVPAVSESRKALKFNDNYFPFLEDLQKRQNINILQKEFLVYEDDMFKDYTHLNHDGAEQFTKYLAAKLSAVLPNTNSAYPSSPKIGGF